MPDILAQVFEAQAAILQARGRKAVAKAGRHRDKLVSNLTDKERTQLRVLTATLGAFC